MISWTIGIDPGRYGALWGINHHTGEEKGYAWKPSQMNRKPTVTFMDYRGQEWKLNTYYSAFNSELDLFWILFGNPYTFRCFLCVEELFIKRNKGGSINRGSLALGEYAGRQYEPLIHYAVNRDILRVRSGEWRKKVLGLDERRDHKILKEHSISHAANLSDMGELAGNEHASDARHIAHYAETQRKLLYSRHQ